MAVCELTLCQMCQGVHTSVSGRSEVLRSLDRSNPEAWVICRGPQESQSVAGRVSWRAQVSHRGVMLWK